jgi:tripartite ATP-independent transporter DctM subunit
VEATLWAVGALLLLLLLGIPLGFGMGLVGAIAFALATGWEPTLGMVGVTTVNAVLNYNFSVLPLFVLMGSLFAHSRMADELYAASYAVIGHRRGGLAMATILACGGFSAISGSAMACAATMTRVSVPMMQRYGYAPSFAAGTVAAGATLDILIPPSNPMVIYAIITETDLGKLMAAGFLPGLLTILCYIVVIVGVARLLPRWAPAGQRTGWPERWRLLRNVWPMVLLFGAVLGGIYFGVFTPTEAAGIGAFGAFVIALARGRLSWRSLLAMLMETARTTTVLFIVLIGALLFANFVTIAGGPSELGAWLKGFAFTGTEIVLLILALYIVLGCLLEGIAMMLLTVPILFPIVSEAGIDPIWFGIFVVIMAGVSSIHPPLGILLYVVRALVPGISTNKIFLGVTPYLVGDAVRLALLIAFPAIVLVVPRMM